MKEHRKLHKIRE